MSNGLYRTTVRELKRALAAHDDNNVVEIFLLNPGGGVAEEFDIYNIYRGGDDNSNICSIELRAVKDRP